MTLGPFRGEGGWPYASHAHTYWSTRDERNTIGYSSVWHGLGRDSCAAPGAAPCARSPSRACARGPAVPRAPSCHRPSVAERAGAARHIVQETSDGNVVRLFFLACLSPAAAASWELGRLAARGAETIALCAGRRPAAAYTFRSVLREHDGAPLPHTPHTEARTDGESRRRRVARTCTCVVRR